MIESIDSKMKSKITQHSQNDSDLVVSFKVHLPRLRGLVLEALDHRNECFVRWLNRTVYFLDF